MLHTKRQKKRKQKKHGSFHNCFALDLWKKEADQKLSVLIKMKSHKYLIEEQVGVANLHLININSQFLPVLCFAANLHILSWYVSGPDINFRKIIHSFSSFQKYAVAEWLDGDMWRHLQRGILLSKIVDTEKRKNYCEEIYSVVLHGGPSLPEDRQLENELLEPVGGSFQRGGYSRIILSTQKM